MKGAVASIRDGQVWRLSSTPRWSLYLHNAQSLSLLHLAQNGPEDLVQLLSELGPGLRDQSGHQPAHEGSRELRRPGVQQLVDHLHDVPQAAVALLVPPLSNLLEGNRDVRPQTFTTVLDRGGEGAHGGWC